MLGPLVAFVRESSPRPTTLSERIVADHLRAATFVIADGITPSNEGRGYVLRRLIRRAAIHGRKIGLTATLSDGVGVAVSMFKDHYPELKQRAKVITEVVLAESERFNKTLEQGNGAVREDRSPAGEDLLGRGCVSPSRHIWISARAHAGAGCGARQRDR